MCVGSSANRANWDTVSNPMGALQSIIHEQSNEIRALRAALDEANTERERLRGELEFANGSLKASSHNEVEFMAELQRKRQRFIEVADERDRVVAQVQRVEALCDEAKANVYGQSWVPLNALRAALAGEGSEQP